MVRAYRGQRFGGSVRPLSDSASTRVNLGRPAANVHIHTLVVCGAYVVFATISAGLSAVTLICVCYMLGQFDFFQFSKRQNDVEKIVNTSCNMNTYTIHIDCTQDSDSQCSNILWRKLWLHIACM